MNILALAMRSLVSNHYHTFRSDTELLKALVAIPVDNEDKQFRKHLEIELDLSNLTSATDTEIVALTTAGLEPET